MRKMSEKQAWLWLAGKWDKAKLRDDCGGFNYFSVIWRACLYTGLCDMLRRMKSLGVLTEDDYLRMRDKIPEPTHYYHGDLVAWSWPNTANGAKRRAAFCRRMARACK